MKKIKIITLALVAFIFSSCEKETTTGGLSQVTNYPIITVDGANPIFLPKGTAFVEPGVTATEDGAEIDVVTSGSGAYRGGAAVNEEMPDRYDVVYTATNKDGYDGTAGRTVYVIETGDMVDNIAGLYKSTIVRNGESKFSDLGYVIVYKNDDGTYGMSCAIGSYYENGVGYGATFNAPATIEANDIASNDFTFAPTSVTYAGWPWAINITNMAVDAGAKTITMTAVWDIGYTFEVTLTQVEI